MISKIKKQIQYLNSLFSFSSLDRLLFDQVNSQKTFSNDQSAPIIVIQCVKDHYYYVLWGLLIKQFRKKHPVEVHMICTSGFVVGESRSFFAYLYGKCTQGYFSDRKWIKLFNSFCNKVGYSHSGIIDALCHFSELFSAIKKWKKIQSKEELLAFSFDTIEVGDLLYDSYLRFKPSPTVDINDPYLILVLWRAIRCYRKATNYFKNTKPALFFTSYTTYAQHGIAVRVAANLGIQVFSFGNIQDLYKKITLDDPYHTKDTSQYKAIFDQLDNQKERLHEAESSLKKRLSGGVDLATFYMKQSAYQVYNEALPDLREYAVIFLHDFFDSPHVYGELLFPDFWIWIGTTFDILLKYQIPFVVKPHPNQIPEAKLAVEKLMKLYPQVQFISSKFSNVQLVEAGMSFAVTVYGTVAHEMSYLGIPTLACGLNPHHAYSFSKVARTIDEYKTLLSNSKLLDQDGEKMKMEALSFYYMHNLYGSAEMLELRNKTLELRTVLGVSFNNKELVTTLRLFEESVSRFDLMKEFMH